eukprot:1502761-Amphidinium_carterae.1
MRRSAVYASEALEPQDARNLDADWLIEQWSVLVKPPAARTCGGDITCALCGSVQQSQVPACSPQMA